MGRSPGNTSGYRSPKSADYLSVLAAMVSRHVRHPEQANEGMV